jgi:hypothetical protein
MPLVDEEGDLFGLVNVADVLLVALLLIVVGGTGALLVSGDDTKSSVLTQVVDVEVEGVPNTVIDEATVGPVESDRVVEILDVTVVESGANNSTVQVQVRLPVQIREGLVTYREERLYVGRTIEIPLGGRNVTGDIVTAAEPERLSKLPTPTPTLTPTQTDRQKTSPTAATSSDTTPGTASTATSTASGTASTATSTASGTASTATRQTSTSPVNRTVRTITVESTVSNETAAAIPTGSVSIPQVQAVVSTEREQVDPGRVRMTVRIQISVVVEEETVFFRGIELKSGQRLRLELGTEPVVWTVVEQ